MILTGEIAIFSSTTTTVTVESARPSKYRLTVKWHHKERVDMSEREKKQPDIKLDEAVHSFSDEIF